MIFIINQNKIKWCSSKHKHKNKQSTYSVSQAGNFLKTCMYIFTVITLYFLICLTTYYPNCLFVHYEAIINKTPGQTDHLSIQYIFFLKTGFKEGCRKSKGFVFKSLTIKT